MNVPHLKDPKAFLVAMETTLPHDKTSTKHIVSTSTPCNDKSVFQYDAIINKQLNKQIRYRNFYSVISRDQHNS